jgi:hypothetical protein
MTYYWVGRAVAMAVTFVTPLLAAYVVFLAFRTGGTDA